MDGLTRMDVEGLTLLDLPEDAVGIIMDFAGNTTRKVLAHVCKRFPCAHLRICEMAARENYFEVLKWAAAAGYVMDAHPRFAAANGNVEMLEWIHTRGTSWYSVDVYTIYDSAISHGHLPIVEWLYAQGYTMTNPHHRAANYGYLHILKWLVDHGHVIDSGVFRYATRHLEVLKWALGRAPGMLNETIFEAAAKHGDIPTLEWLWAEGCPHDAMSTIAAASAGHFDALGWLHSRGIPLSSAIPREAAKIGHLEMLKWTVEVGCPQSALTWWTAAHMGHIVILRWMIEAGLYINRNNVCAVAAAYGQLDLLKWLRSEGFPWDERVGENAIGSGHFDTLVWAVENGCPRNFNHWKYEAIIPEIDPERYDRMETGNGLKILQYLHSLGCMMNTPELCENAATIGDIEMLEWLRGLGCPWNAETCKYARDDATRDWLHSAECPPCGCMSAEG